MSDDLEPQVSEVPEQGEFFRQGMGNEDPEPEPQAEPEPEPEPELELPEVEPEWLNAPQEPPPQQQQYQQPPQYYEPPPQYQQQPPPRPRTDAELEAFVDNPDAWFEKRMTAREQQMLGPLAQQQQQVAQMVNMLMQTGVNEKAAQADKAIRDAYKILNKDSAFRSNKTMQSQIGATLKGMREQAVQAARYGNFGPLNNLLDLNESKINGTLAYMRATLGVKSPGVSPLQVEGATVESSRSSVAGKGVELSPEEEEIARRMGRGYRSRMIKAKADQKKYDDLETK